MASAEWLVNLVFVTLGLFPTARYRDSTCRYAVGVVPETHNLLRRAAAGRKGVRELVDAVGLITLRGFPVELRIAGDGPLKAFVKKKAQDTPYLTYLGRLSETQVASELDRATLFVNPSNYPEGLPTVLLEAGAAALPVLSTSRGGSAELIRNGETGWLITDGTATLIAEAVLAVIQQPGEAIRRGAALFRLVNAEFTWPTIVNAFIGHLTEHPDR